MLFWLIFIYLMLGLWLGITVAVGIYRHQQVCPAHEKDWYWQDTIMFFLTTFLWPVVLIWAFHGKSNRG